LAEGADFDAQVRTSKGSVAASRGINWANAEASRRASAVTRPIRVEVTADQLAIFDASAAGGPRPADATVVTFQQPVDQVMDQLAAAVQEHITDWGLAGSGMYWRPMLVVSVSPGAERQAARLAELLENSGVDVRLPTTAARPATGRGHATR
jgi:hypothetical protein